MIKNSTPERELVERLIGGDEIAFNEIFYCYKDKLFSYCYRFAKSKVMAEEIVQEVLVKIWTSREKINPELSFSSYLYTIARNHSLNFLKKAASDHAFKERLLYHFERNRHEFEAEMNYNELSRLADRAIASLPPKRRQIFQMSRDSSMNYEDIANYLGISKHTVKNQIVQARKSIRDYLSLHEEIGLFVLFALSLSYTGF
jgi:RNA polymerase sigma-70 factor (ECF subfamily)